MNSAPTPVITVIVAVHNVERYLSECLESIIRQTEPRLEILCVDDASTDNSSEILRQYLVKDPRLRVHRLQDNQGLSAARNIGASLAVAPWVIFIDGDDVASRRLCEVSLAAAIKHSADVVFYDFAYFEDGSAIPPESIVGGSRLADRGELLGRKSFAWTKLISAELMRRKEIVFPLGLCMQDVPVHWRLVLESRTPAVVDQPLVWYRQRRSSISYDASWKRADGFTVYDITRHYLEDSGSWEKWQVPFLVAELNYFADIHAKFLYKNQSLVRRAQAEVMSRMTLAHWRLALEGSGITSWGRDYLVSLCRPTGGARSLRQVIPSARYWLRRMIRPAANLRHTLLSAAPWK